MRRNLELLLVFLLLTAHAAHSSSIRVSIELRAERPDQRQVQGILKITSAQAQDQTRELEIPFEAPGEQEIDLPPGLWDARFEAKGFWSETVNATNAATGTPLRIRVFPAASLRGRVVLPKGDKPLPAVTVRLQPPFGPGQEKELELAFSCPIQDGNLACDSPSGLFDARLRTEAGFAPVYFWNLSIPAGKKGDLGEIALRRGASVSGWVQTADGSPLSKECRLKLAPASAPPETLSLEDRLAKTALTAEPNERGFFQIAGVPPGRYQITALQPGFAPASVDGIDVRPDLESQVIERLILDRPAVLEIALDPPMEPYGNLWRIELYRRSDPSDPPAESHIGNATPEGVWKSPGITPGTYELRVVGDLKSVWHRESVEVRKGQPPVEVRLPVLRLKGTVLLGDEPLSATLWLGGEKGKKIRFDADEDGRFTGVLPAAGLWAAAVEAEGVRSVLEPMEIRPPQGKSVAEVEIVVPNTSLAGQVVDDSGKPVPGAGITVVGMGKKRYQTQLTTDDEGRFSARGLRPGPISIYAEQGELQTEFVQAAVPEEGTGPDLRLVLKRFRKLQGRVVSSNGGVPGALVHAWTAFSGQTAVNAAQSVTGPDGRFEVSLPDSSSLVSFAVLPPGYGMRLLTVLAQPGQSLEIPVDPQGGTLVIETVENGPPPLLVHNGTFLLIPMLKTWSRLQGGPTSDPNRLLVPNVAAGSYSLCVGAAAVSRLREGGEPPAASCASGVLNPNGELVLKAPGATASR